MVENAGDGGRDEDDRVVSRRVDNPTGADPGDDAVYRAADPAPDDSSPSVDTPAGDRRSAGGTAESIEDEMKQSDESEPDRSE